MEIALNRVAKTILRRALVEDLGVRGDVTTIATIPEAKVSGAVIIAKSSGVIAGQAVAEAVFKSLDRSLKYDAVVKDGEAVAPGTVIARLKGPTRAILSGERTALNILGRCCGIATLTRRFVEAVAGTRAKISETRKTAPGLRYLDKAAVRIGGGVNHRCALYDAFLIKENHIAAAGGISRAVEACRQSGIAGGRLRVMVEARNLDEFREAFAARPDRILLDNMSPEQIANCKLQIANCKLSIETEATGGITLNNVRVYAETGVDFISIGALTHSVEALDLSLLILEAQSIAENLGLKRQ